MPLIKVTGYIDVDELELDPDPVVGPLTAEADQSYRRVAVGHLDDVTFELAEASDGDE